MVQSEFGHEKRDALFRLADEYSLFFLTWISKRKSRSGATWSTLRGTPAWRAWSGLTYGVRNNEHARTLGVNSVTTDALFRQI